MLHWLPLFVLLIHPVLGSVCPPGSFSCTGQIPCNYACKACNGVTLLPCNATQDTICSDPYGQFYTTGTTGNTYLTTASLPTSFPRLNDDRTILTRVYLPYSTAAQNAIWTQTASKCASSDMAVLITYTVATNSMTARVGVCNVGNVEIPITPNAWYYVAVTYASRVLTLLLSTDGISWTSAQNTFTVNLATSVNLFEIGRRATQTPNYYYPGLRMNFLRVWDRVLSLPQLTLAAGGGMIGGGGLIVPESPCGQSAGPVFELDFERSTSPATGLLKDTVSGGAFGMTSTPIAATFILPCQPGYVDGLPPCTPVNACATTNGGCDAHAACTFTGPNTRTCACNTGYSGSGLDGQCTAVNACATTNGGCSSNAVCTPTGPGTVSCACNAGYSGSGTTCTDVDECSPMLTWPCAASGAQCTNSVGSYACACNAGYFGDGYTSCLVNACATANGGCDAHAVCTPTGAGTGTVACACNSGYTGSGASGACSPVNACATANGGCDVNAGCTPTGPNTRTCACNAGFINSGTALVGQCTPARKEFSCTPGGLNITCKVCPGRVLIPCSSFTDTVCADGNSQFMKLTDTGALGMITTNSAMPAGNQSRTVHTRLWLASMTHPLSTIVWSMGRGSGGFRLMASGVAGSSNFPYPVMLNASIDGVEGSTVQAVVLAMYWVDVMVTYHSDTQNLSLLVSNEGLAWNTTSAIHPVPIAPPTPPQLLRALWGTVTYPAAITMQFLRIWNRVISAEERIQSASRGAVVNVCGMFSDFEFSGPDPALLTDRLNPSLTFSRSGLLLQQCAYIPGCYAYSSITCGCQFY